LSYFVVKALPAKIFMDKFNKFISQLSQRLQNPLPGKDAHAKMASSSKLKLMSEPNEKTRKSAILILFYPYQDEIYLPLILRPAYDGVHGGQMAFPGGGIEKEDENLNRTALRESQEEIGIKAIDITVLGQMTELFIPPSNFTVLPVIGFISYRPDFYPDAREVDKMFEISLNEIQNPAIISRKIINVRGYDIDAPHYNIQENVVWGATAMMVSELLSLISDFEK
jgi:8-oxo-dGTP pyrophosphatase MutT (NUDIX family)